MSESDTAETLALQGGYDAATADNRRLLIGASLKPTASVLNVRYVSGIQPGCVCVCVWQGVMQL